MSGKRTWKLKRPRKRTHRAPNAWQRSLAFREMARAAITAFNATRKRLPKCGAKTRTTGEPCKNPALENGRCRLHGGATPSGKEWGKRQVSTKSSTRNANGDWRRVEEKLQRWAREDRDRAHRLRRMTDEQFWRYVRRMGRRLDGDPFSPSFQKVVRDEKARRGPDPAKAGKLLPIEPVAVSAEVQKIDAHIAELRAELAAREKGDRPAAEKSDLPPMTGVFG